MTERITNPMEFSDCHRNVTVVMENRFTVPNGRERGEEPLKLFGKWSHVKVALIDSNRQSLSYRIYPREMGLIRRKTDAVICNSTLNPVEGNQQGQNGMAFGKLYGRYAGMTAAAALQKYGRQAMMAQRDYLSQHLSGQYGEKNRQQMAAIDAAITMADNGTLNAEAARPVQIFDSGLRGRSEKVMQFTIAYIPGANMPFVLSMCQWLNVPIVNRSNGAKVFSLKNVPVNKKVSVSLTEMEWADLVDSIMDQIHLHKLLAYPTAFASAVKMQEQIDRTWKTQTGSQNRVSQNPQAPAPQPYNEPYESYNSYDSYGGEWM